MKNSSPSARRRALLLAFGLAVAGSLTWSATALNAGSPSVAVNVDSKPVPAANSALGPSYAPVVKKAAPSVVKVQVTERAKNVSAQDAHPFFNQPGFREFFGDQFGP